MKNGKNGRIISFFAFFLVVSTIFIFIGNVLAEESLDDKISKVLEVIKQNPNNHALRNDLGILYVNKALVVLLSI